jgi:uncharacterized membrane protein
MWMANQPRALLKASVAGLLAVVGLGVAGARVQALEGDAGGEKVPCYGINKCKGTGACGGVGHSCAGQNTCQGQGYLEVDEETCLKIEGGRLTPEPAA